MNDLDPFMLRVAKGSLEGYLEPFLRAAGVPAERKLGSYTAEARAPLERQLELIR